MQLDKTTCMNILLENSFKGIYHFERYIRRLFEEYDNVYITSDDNPIEDKEYLCSKYDEISRLTYHIYIEKGDKNER